MEHLVCWPFPVLNYMPGHFKILCLICITKKSMANFWCTLKLANQDPCLKTCFLLIWTVIFLLSYCFSLYLIVLWYSVFVTTAANAHEHSYACYFDGKRGTYLGDVYSVMWMEDSEQEDLTHETLFRQFSIVRTQTNTSHVQVWTSSFALSELLLILDLLMISHRNTATSKSASLK